MTEKFITLAWCGFLIGYLVGRIHQYLKSLYKDHDNQTNKNSGV